MSEVHVLLLVNWMK